MYKSKAIIFSFGLVGVALVVFVLTSLQIMRNIPFYDFDEAHRAENAKRMKEYGSYLVPLTGSGFDRISYLRIPMKDRPDINLYYHLERPSLVYILMIISISILGSNELAYRLPSLLFGVSTIILFIYLVKRLRARFNSIAFIIAITSLICSRDLWLSAQYAQLDTAITFFLFLSLGIVLIYLQSKDKRLLYFAGLSAACAVLSKGQPAVIFGLPVLFLMITRKIDKRAFFHLFWGSATLMIPWLIYLAFKFNLSDAFTIFSGFAVSHATVEYLHIKAPIFWYVRWWWESLRPGWTLFLALLILDLYYKRLDLRKVTLLVYILGSLVFFSVAVNKIWWYVLPLIPVLCLYIYFSAADFIEKHQDKAINLILVFVIASLPVYLKTTNTFGLLYGFSVTLLSVIILHKFRLNLLNRFNIKELSLILAIITAFVYFNLRFPMIKPYHRDTKEVALFYKSLPGTKCLWTRSMPQEAVLFYSEAGEVKYLNHGDKLPSYCKHYLITPDDSTLKTKFFLDKDNDQEDGFLEDKKVIFKKGELSLVEL